jgi:hypothetical protein
MANDAEVSQYVNERTANRAAEKEAPTYAWTVEGYVTSGALTQYATDLREAHYAGLAVGDVLWTGEELIRPHVVQGEWGEDDYATGYVTLHRAGHEPDEASYRIDGRA